MEWNLLRISKKKQVLVNTQSFCFIFSKPVRKKKGMNEMMTFIFAFQPFNKTFKLGNLKIKILVLKICFYALALQLKFAQNMKEFERNQ